MEMKVEEVLCTQKLNNFLLWLFFFIVSSSVVMSLHTLSRYTYFLASYTQPRRTLRALGICTYLR